MYPGHRCHAIGAFRHAALQPPSPEWSAFQPVLTQDSQHMHHGRSRHYAAVSAGMSCLTEAPLCCGHARCWQQAEEARVAFALEAIATWLQSGHTERAIGGIQAMVEFTTFAPPFPPGLASRAGQVRHFRSFWDSGAPRVGEEGAAGWSTWMMLDEQRKLQPLPPPPPPMPPAGADEVIAS